MEAKVKDSARFQTYVFFSGHEFVKGDWRPVPADSEAQARAEAVLEIREERKDESGEFASPEVPYVISPAEDYEYINKKAPRRGRKRKAEYAGDDDVVED